MWDFSGDEWLAGALGAVAVLIFGWRFYRPLFSISLLGRSLPRRVCLTLFPFLSLIAALVSISSWSDPRVAGHPDYIAPFLVIGMASVFTSPIFGASQNP
jgi:hypothetical protein